jgi:hypothetical protein
VAENINTRLSIILKSWEIITDVGVMTGKIHFFRESLQKYLQNDKHFYKNVVNTFFVRVLNVDDLTRKREVFLSKNTLKQIQYKWIGRINIL